MRFYVPVGPRGVVFRVGMVWTDVTGRLVYWRASRRRQTRGPVSDCLDLADGATPDGSRLESEVGVLTI